MSEDNLTNRGVIERLRLVIDHVNLPRADFAKKIGLDTADQLSSLINGRVKIGKLHAKALKLEFNIDEEWFLFGNGEMQKTGVNECWQPKAETAENVSEFFRRKEEQGVDAKLAKAQRTLFKLNCPGYFDDFFDFVAENYGEDKDAVDEFLAKLEETHTNYRFWLNEKKREREDLQNRAGKNITGSVI